MTKGSARRGISTAKVMDKKRQGCPASRAGSTDESEGEKGGGGGSGWRARPRRTRRLRGGSRARLSWALWCSPRRRHQFCRLVASLTAPAAALNSSKPATDAHDILISANGVRPLLIITRDAP